MAKGKPGSMGTNIPRHASSHCPAFKTKDFPGVQCRQWELREKTAFRAAFQEDVWGNLPERPREQARYSFVLRESEREQSKGNLEGCSAPPLVLFKIIAKFKLTASPSPSENELPVLGVRQRHITPPPVPRGQSALTCAPERNSSSPLTGERGNKASSNSLLPDAGQRWSSSLSKGCAKRGSATVAGTPECGHRPTPRLVIEGACFCPGMPYIVGALEARMGAVILPLEGYNYSQKRVLTEG